MADLINAEKSTSLEKTTSDVSLEQQSNTSERNVPSSDDDDMRQSSFSTSTYPIGNQKHPNVLENLRKHNRNSSEISFGWEDYVIEREKNTKLEENILPPRKPSSYNMSSSSRSISSDEGGSTISRNTNAVSRRTRGRRLSVASTAESLSENQIIDGNNLIYDSNYEEEKIKPGLNETNYPRKRDMPFGYKSKSEEEVEGSKPVYEPNHPWNQHKMNQSGKSDSIDDNGSIQGSIISEEDIDERAYPRSRNSYASFDGSTSSRSFSSDEAGSRIGAGESRFIPRRTCRLRGSNGDIPGPQNELHDVVNELARIGITREKLLMLLLQQTEASINDKPMHPNRSTRSLVRQLSVQVPPPQTSDSGSSRGKRRPAKHHCRSLLGGTPFVLCHGCATLLQLPIGMPTKRFVRIRCGECSETQVCPFPAKDVTYNPLHKVLGYQSARFLMAPSRQFSIEDGMEN